MELDFIFVSSDLALIFSFFFLFISYIGVLIIDLLLFELYLLLSLLSFRMEVFLEFKILFAVLLECLLAFVELLLLHDDVLV